MVVKYTRTTAAGRAARANNSKPSTSIKGKSYSGGSASEIEKAESRLNVLKKGTTAYNLQKDEISRLKGQGSSISVTPVHDSRSSSQKAYDTARSEYDKGQTDSARFRNSIAELNRQGIKPSFTDSKKNQEVMRETSRTHLKKLAGTSFDTGVKGSRYVETTPESVFRGKEVELETRGTAGSIGVGGFIQAPREDLSPIKTGKYGSTRIVRTETPSEFREKLSKKAASQQFTTGGLVTASTQKQTKATKRAKLKEYVGSRASSFKSGFLGDFRQPEQNFDFYAAGALLSIPTGGVIGKGVKASKAAITSSKVLGVVSKSKPIQLFQTGKVALKSTWLGRQTYTAGRLGTTALGIDLGFKGTEKLTRKHKFDPKMIREAEIKAREESKLTGNFFKSSAAELSVFTGSKAKFKESLTRQAQEKGLSASQTKSFIEAGIRRKRFTGFGEITQLIGTGAITESAGRAAFIRLGAKKTLTGTGGKIALKSGWQGFKIIAPLGFQEGIIQDVSQAKARGNSVTLEGVAVSGGVGALSAGVLGGGIVGLGTAKRTLKAAGGRTAADVSERGISLFGNILDPSEYPGDLLEKGVRKSSLFIKGGKKVTPVLSFTTGGTATFSTTSKDIKPFSTKSFVSTKTPVKTTTKVQTKTTVKVTARSTLETMLSVPSQPLVPTKTLITTPSIGTPSIGVTTPTETPTETKTEVKVPTPVSINIKTFSPQPRLMTPFLPPLFPSSKGKGTGRQPKGKIINELAMAQNLFFGKSKKEPFMFGRSARTSKLNTNRKDLFRSQNKNVRIKKNTNRGFRLSL